MKITYGRQSVLVSLLLVFLLALGLGLRLINLTNPPLDFQSTRQLRAAIIARGMYYQMLPSADPAVRQTAVFLWKFQEPLEPQILERIVAVTYLIAGGEHLWLARLLSILFWMVGGVFLFALAKRMTSAAGALAALAFYMVSPFGITASRSFQPDPMMIMWLLITAYAIYRWGENPTWKWALLAGLCGGIVILIKVVTAFMVLPALLAMVLAVRGFRKVFTDKHVWVMICLLIVIPVFYYLFIYRAAAEGTAYSTLRESMQLLRTGKFYTGWLTTLDGMISLPWIVLGLVGTVLLPSKGRAMVSGLWGGYGVFVLVFAYRSSTHEQYRLPLIPIAALSLAVIASWIVEKIAGQPVFWKFVFAGLVLITIGYPAWLGRSGLLAKDYRGEPGGWKKLGESLPTDGQIIALTHDYGNLLQYYAWRLVAYWPTPADLNLKALDGVGINQANFQSYFDSQISGKKYFLVTLMGDFDAEPLLKSMLYDHYTVISEDQTHVLFDLSKPLKTP